MKLIYISGGQRSGKSRFAQKCAQAEAERPVYLATSRILDEELKVRVERHKTDRADKWDCVEIEKEISGFPYTQFREENRVVVLDCLTLWLTNYFCDLEYDTEKTLATVKQEWDKFIQLPLTVYVVSNEIGMGVIPADEISRKFIDLQGFMNQYIAEKADEVWFMISGRSMRVIAP